MTNEELLNLFEKTALGKPFNLSDNTVDRYLYYINQLLTVSKKEIVDITKADIKLYLMGLKTSDSYYNANLSAFRTLFKVLSRKWGLICERRLFNSALARIASSSSRMTW